MPNATRAYNQLVHGFWFLHAYAFMMMLAPLVNAAMEKGERTAIVTVVPLVAMVWCWGFGLTLPVIGDKLPRTPGLDAYGGITLLAIYAAARLCRICEVGKRMKTKWLVFSLPVLWILTGIGFGDYNSPFAFALAGACFFLFSRVPLPEGVGRFVTMLAPSMFTVYLIHTNELGERFVCKSEAWLADAGVNWVCAIGVTAVAVFGVAVAMDVPRRLGSMWVGSAML